METIMKHITSIFKVKKLPRNSGKGIMNTEQNIMVFRPTWAEFQNFNKYIEHMESLGAHKAGIAKVIPPREWSPRRNPYITEDILNINIPYLLNQSVTGQLGYFKQRNFVAKRNSMKVKDYKEIAESRKYKSPGFVDFAELERKFWKTVIYKEDPLYGADVSGSLIDKDVNVWNINKLDTILDFVVRDYGRIIDGINTAYLYFGMWKTAFSWHTEDMDLYSINYLHYGSPKSWYAIPPAQGRRFESIASELFPDDTSRCSAFLRHKQCLISPTLLKERNIQINQITQEAGEFIITFPYGYHSGYNNGFNIAEAGNFALPRWVEYGKRAKLCDCGKNNVVIDMTTFVKRFQPERYDVWIKGKDVGCHPEDPSRVFAAPLQF